MNHIFIDLETRSDVDLTKTGVYRYADSPYFDILLFAYSVDDGISFQTTSDMFWNSFTGARMKVRRTLSMKYASILALNVLLHITEKIVRYSI